MDSFNEPMCFQLVDQKVRPFKWNWWNFKYFQWGLCCLEELNVVMADCNNFSFSDGKHHFKP